MEDVDYQRVTSDEVKKRDSAFKKSVGVAVFDCPPRKITEYKEENPRNYRKVVGRVKIGRRKADKCKRLYAVQKFGQSEKLCPEKADITVGNSVQKSKQEQTASCADGRLDVFKITFQRIRNHHCTAEEIQNSEPHSLTRNNKHGNNRY